MAKELEAQIAQEKEELENAPVIQPMTGRAGRCSICGRVAPRSELTPYDMHTQTIRYACSWCNPKRKP